MTHSIFCGAKCPITFGDQHLTDLFGPHDLKMLNFGQAMDSAINRRLSGFLGRG
jgi:hypothetical protein